MSNDIIIKNLIDLYLNYLSLKKNIDVLDNKLDDYNSSILDAINDELIEDKNKFINFCNSIKNELGLLSLEVIKKIIVDSWNESININKLIDEKDNLKLFLVPLDKFTQNSGDILIGFYANEYADDFKNYVNIYAGYLLLIETRITRGMNVMLNQPIPLISLSNSKLRIESNNKGMYAICASFTNNDYRSSLIKDSFSWGAYIYSDGYVKRAIYNESILSIKIIPKSFSFGKEIINIKE